MTEQKGSGGGDTWGVRKAMERRETTRWRCTVRVPWTGIYLLRSDTSNWLWNVSSHITAILMSWPAESIVEKIPFSAVDICTCWIDNTCDTSGDKHVERITMERSTGRSPWRYIHICIVKFHKRLCDPFWDSPRDEATVRWIGPRRKERDPIVKLVVACCSSEFHITAIFDDLDRRFTHRPLRLHRATGCNTARIVMQGPLEEMHPQLRRRACSRCSQSGCNMLM